jgi:hypothetical protein
MLLKFIVGNLRKEQSRSFISSSSFDYRFNVVGSYKQETLKLRSFILRFSRIHLVNRYRSGFHRTRVKVVPLLPPVHYSMLSNLQSITENISYMLPRTIGSSAKSICTSNSLDSPVVGDIIVVMSQFEEVSCEKNF